MKIERGEGEMSGYAWGKKTIVFKVGIFLVFICRPFRGTLGLLKRETTIVGFCSLASRLCKWKNMQGWREKGGDPQCNMK